MVDDALAVSDKEGHDVEAEVRRWATKECGDGSCDGAVDEAGDEAVDEAEDEAVDEAVDKVVDDECGRSGAEVEEGENCT